MYQTIAHLLCLERLGRVSSSSSSGNGIKAPSISDAEVSLILDGGGTPTVSDRTSGCSEGPGVHVSMSNACSLSIIIPQFAKRTLYLSNCFEGGIHNDQEHQTHEKTGIPWQRFVIFYYGKFPSVKWNFLTTKMTAKPSFSIWAYLRLASVKVQEAYAIRRSSPFGHRHLGMNVTAEEGQAVGRNDPLHSLLHGPVNDQLGQAQEQTYKEILQPAHSPLYQVPEDQEHGAEMQPKPEEKNAVMEAEAVMTSWLHWVQSMAAAGSLDRDFNGRRSSPVQE
eukprot:g40566.t1